MCELPLPSGWMTGSRAVQNSLGAPGGKLSLLEKQGQLEAHGLSRWAEMGFSVLRVMGIYMAAQ